MLNLLFLGILPIVSSAEIQPLSPGLSIWQNYDSSIKTELFSAAVRTKSGVYVVDPIPLADVPLRELSQSGPIAGIVVTNANHVRDSLAYSDRFSAPLFAHSHTFPEPKPARFVQATNANPIGNDLEVIEIDGAVEGEIALYHAGNGGTFIVGDALINFDPYGFTFLPRKYCLNEKQMRRSLRQLRARPAERVLFAHGTPILSGASARLRQLLDVEL